MKRFLKISAVIFFTGSVNLQAQKQAIKKPNIILIMTDDQGYGDFGFTGNPYVKTPNIDKLAARSVRLTNFHNSPVCAPTRASLLTGRYAQRTGVHDTYNNGAIMATEEITIAEILGQNGYKTGIVGKWHLGDNYPFRPSEQGFQYSLVHGGGGIGQPGDLIENFTRPDSSYFNTVLSENNKHVFPKGYCTDIFTDAALGFLKENKSKPFFLYVSYNAPHDPLQLPKKYEDQYKDLKFDSALDKDSGKSWSKMTEKDKENARKVYGMATNIDDNVGRILEEIKKQNLEENTIVIFLTDNGNQQLRFNTGFRGLKGLVYEGGTHVPFLISGKGFIPENKDLDGLTAHVDLLPTLLEASGVPIPKVIKADGRSVFKQILGKQKPEERIFYNAWNRGWPEPYRNAAIYQGNYKLVASEADPDNLNTFGLFNLKTDPFEENNLVKSDKNLALKLKNKLDSTFKEIAASPNLSPRRIEIGTIHENPVILTRQDLSGTAMRNWTGENALGTWTVRVKEEGVYDFKAISIKTIPKGTRALIRLGQIQRSKFVNDENKTVSFTNIYLKKGDYDIESWFETIASVNGPFYLEVLKHK
ncbi:arylsulfatase [Dyadobacter frigoris]|uniref:Arylsulfatase n=1 Tax=Dyadobacter frigoris TaxID=2576211 RepID=A0A4U6CYD6_9BACT|nr:arylsulfatase [Dyadobacter frigoris]TKT88875.1 arylsulfatase [Dyadobacter frigoris]GLU56068.1 arylsulfatase [Dyadobacter frigoris]